ncbi:unnamed protein product [Onchocerca ochengi]|uniref:Fibrous sheath-interacting protein 1 n=1 Tax=Onchocerca ochengi TaxID=42157 RepID=A0A182E308_ONCOC|nr:unnamed protein product [Onchocerca ochengi]
MSSSSVCSGYRYKNQRPFLMYQKPPEFSWFSTALKNIKETNNEAKIEKEMEKNCTVVALSSKFTTSEECPATVLKMDDNQSESVANGIELKSDVTVVPVDHNVGLLNTIYSNKSNWETHRKSLTAAYLEKKNLEKETDLMERSQERLRSGEFPSTRIAKDEGPVRQSLLSLVMDEDVPELMEAMAEKLEFVFEDLIPTISNAGEGILRNSAKRSRSRPREARLEFHSSSPTVFTYPDEESAVEKAQWDEGKQITFSVYRELFEGKKERSMDENHKSQNPLRPSQIANNTEFSFVRTVTLMEEPSVAESLLGVTGRISYNNAPMDLARFNKNTISLVAGK